MDFLSVSHLQYRPSIALKRHKIDKFYCRGAQQQTVDLVAKAENVCKSSLYHEQQNVNILRQIHVTKLSPQMSILMNYEAVKH